MALLPEAERLLAEYGLHCTGCVMGGMETLEDGCRIHGFSKDDTGNLLTDLNTLLRARMHRPRTLTMTDGAATALRELLKKEGKSGVCLCVGSDQEGALFLELLRTIPRGAEAFSHAHATALRIVAVPPVSYRVRGATIDYRDGRFTLT